MRATRASARARPSWWRSRQCRRRPRRPPPKRLLEREPLLRSDGLTGGIIYYDCATDDGRLTLENAIGAVEAGAAIATRAKVVAIDNLTGSGPVGVTFRDEQTGIERTLRAKAVINATGVWADRIRTAAQHPMLAAVALWAFSHLLVNGDLASLLLFGPFLVYAGYDIISANQRGAVGPLGKARGGLAQDVAAIAIGLALYALLLFWGHRILTGIPLLA